MENRSLRKWLVSLLMVIPLIAKANLIWPSLFFVETYYSWYVILAGLLVETIAARIFLKTGWLRSLGVMLSVNAISAVLGILLIPLSGVLVEVLMLPFGGGTFDISHWILDYVFAALANTCVEGLSMKLIFKYPFKKVFWWLLAANSVSIIICCVVPLIQ